MSLSPRRIDRAHAKLHRTMAALLRGHPESHKFVSAVLELLSQIELARQSKREYRVPAIGRPFGHVYKKGVIGYTVDVLGKDESLYELRPDRAYKCSHDVYRALARCLADAAER